MRRRVAWMIHREAFMLRREASVFYRSSLTLPLVGSTLHTRNYLGAREAMWRMNTVERSIQ